MGASVRRCCRDTEVSEVTAVEAGHMAKLEERRVTLQQSYVPTVKPEGERVIK